MGDCCAGLVQLGNLKTGGWGEKQEGRKKAGNRPDSKKLVLLSHPCRSATPLLRHSPPLPLPSATPHLRHSPPPSFLSSATSLAMSSATTVPTVMPVPAALAPSQAGTFGDFSLGLLAEVLRCNKLSRLEAGMEAAKILKSYYNKKRSASLTAVFLASGGSYQETFDYWRISIKYLKAAG